MPVERPCLCCSTRMAVGFEGECTLFCVEPVPASCSFGFAASSRVPRPTAGAVQNAALEGRLFYKQSFSIYGGVAGLYDYGPPGTAVKANITQFWRQHFVFSESMLEIECPAVTPETVLKPSGHVDRFVDFMVTDEQGNCLRADHVLEAKLEEIAADPKADADLKKVRRDLASFCPKTNNRIRSFLRVGFTVVTRARAACSARRRTWPRSARWTAPRWRGSFRNTPARRPKSAAARSRRRSPSTSCSKRPSAPAAI